MVSPVTPPLSPQIGGGGGTITPAPSTTAPTNVGAPLGSGLGDLFDLTGGVGTLSGSYVAPKTVSGAARLGVKGGTDPRACPPQQSLPWRRWGST